MPPLAAERLQRHKPDRGGGELEVADQQLPLLLAPLPLDEEQLVSGHRRRRRTLAGERALERGVGVDDERLCRRGRGEGVARPERHALVRLVLELDRPAHRRLAHRC